MYTLAQIGYFKILPDEICEYIFRMMLCVESRGRPKFTYGDEVYLRFKLQNCTLRCNRSTALFINRAGDIGKKLNWGNSKSRHVYLNGKQYFWERYNIEVNECNIVHTIKNLGKRELNKLLKLMGIRGYNKLSKKQCITLYFKN